MSRLMRISVLLVATLAAASVAVAAPELPDGQSNRYQLVVHENVMYVMDTTTGRCWSKRSVGKIWTDHGSPAGIDEAEPLPETPLSLKLPQELVTMTIRQRESKVIPGSDGRIRIRLDDITAGQVIISISAGGNRPNAYPDQVLLEERSVKPSEVVSFVVNDVEYFVRIKELTNVLIGTDIAVVEVASHTKAFSKNEPGTPKVKREKADDDTQVDDKGDGRG